MSYGALSLADRLTPKDLPLIAINIDELIALLCFQHKRKQ